jgi:hypothetical protein
VRSDLQRCLEIDPAYEICRRFAAVSELIQGRVDNALPLYEAGLQKGYLNSDAFFVPPLAARGDRIGALGILALTYQDKPELIGLLFRAITDPSFSDRDRKEGIALVNTGLPNKDLVLQAFWILKAYDQIAALPLAEAPVIWWVPGDEGWIRSPARKTMMKQWRLPEYWHKHGFPPQCKAIAGSDFDCH